MWNKNVLSVHVFGGHGLAVLVQRRIMVDMLYGDYLSRVENLKERYDADDVRSCFVSDSVYARAHVF